MMLLLMIQLESGIGSVQAAQAHNTGGNPGVNCATAHNPTGGPSCGGPITYSAREQLILAKKNALVREFEGVLAGTFSAATYQRDWLAFMRQYGGPTYAARNGNARPFCGNGCSYKIITMPQQPQLTNYYCGPASASEALSARGINVSQSTLAGNNYLQTDENLETSWYPPVMPSTLNAITNSSFYIAYYATSTNNVSVYEGDLMQDINGGWAVVIGVKEIPGSSPHLVGHPTNMTIYHWVAAYGYDSYGANTYYDDSVSGTTFWSWSKNVPPSSYLPSSSMWTMMNQGGFGWVW